MSIVNNKNDDSKMDTDVPDSFPEIPNYKVLSLIDSGILIYIFWFVLFL